MTFSLLVLACNNTPSNRVAAPRAAPQQTVDAADAVLNDPPPGFVAMLGGASTSGIDKSQPLPSAVTVCDQSNLYDAPTKVSTDGYTEITGLTAKNQVLRVCSYAIMNGPTPQDVQFFRGTGTTESGSENGCGIDPQCVKPFMTYHLGPYQTITRGSGVGALYFVASNPPGLNAAGICVHRSNGLAPLGLEFTYAIY